MNSTSAQDNFALVSRVLNLDVSPSSTGKRWQVNIDELEIVITPDSSGQQLSLSHDLGKLSGDSKPGAELQVGALAEHLIPSEVGSVVYDSNSKALSICHSLDVSDGNDCALSILLPRFVKACAALRTRLAREAIAPTPPVQQLIQSANTYPSMKKRCQIALCAIEKSNLSNDISSN